MQKKKISQIALDIYKGTLKTFYVVFLLVLPVVEAMGPWGHGGLDWQANNFC